MFAPVQISPQWWQWVFKCVCSEVGTPLFDEPWRYGAAFVDFGMGMSMFITQCKKWIIFQVKGAFCPEFVSCFFAGKLPNRVLFWRKLASLAVKRLSCPKIRFQAEISKKIFRTNQHFWCKERSFTNKTTVIILLQSKKITVILGIILAYSSYLTTVTVAVAARLLAVILRV